MKYLNFTSEYNKEPEFKARKEFRVWNGYKDITLKIKSAIEGLNKDNITIAIELYPGVRVDEIRKGIIENLEVDFQLFSDEYALSGEEIREKFDFLITDDRVFGRMSSITLSEYFKKEKIAKAKDLVKRASGVKVIYGTGATLIEENSDFIIYCDLARWEAQQRMRSKEQGNWRDDNFDEDMLIKYKRGYFLDWRVADRIKVELSNSIDFYLDTNVVDAPKMVEFEDLKTTLEDLVKNPFRLVPYFDPGVWGGQWMKEVCNLDKSKTNYAWSFDGVPEENSLYLRFKEVRIEVPAINLVLMYPRELLGERVFARYGAEFPIRFDFLDTFEGQNLSLQVHPLKQYIKDKFGMDYTQDESYYILDSKEDANVYLGLKTGVNKEDFIKDLYRAEKGEISFTAEKYINIIPVKKHDHVLIPAGTLHCSGSGTMVLEISATPYIFTFKLWDWNRVGLDGRPRPVHISHGEKVIDWRRDTNWVNENLVNNIKPISNDKDTIVEETGLHSFEPIKTERTWFEDTIKLDTKGTVNMLNLVEGKKVIVESTNNSFKPMIINYAETFIVPANVGKYTIRNLENNKCGVLRAFIGGTNYDR